ncbi:MAG TPA: DUF6580 family putative transport protein [Patescibacteria group bacterium]|nr:DUF6580 family putative transport protein [Patescibacteria group bacterium]
MKLQKIDTTQDKGIYLVLAASLIMFAVFGRLLPHPPNFTPIAAVAIFGGAILPRRYALSLPLAAMIISDLVIGLHPLILFTWGSFAAIAVLSSHYMKRLNVVWIIGASLSASVLFYLISNLGVWLQGTMYPMTAAGLINCYYMALPFFRNTVLGDSVFSATLFGLYALAYTLASNRAERVPNQ